MAFSALLSPSASPCLFVSCRSPSIRGDFHGCPPAFGWRSRYGCVNLNVAVALPVPVAVRASVRVIGSVSVVPSCPAVALSARAVSNFPPPACRPSFSSPFFVVIVAVAKALRPLDSLVYPLRCVVPVYILILCARCRSLPLFIVVASVDCGATPHGDGYMITPKPSSLALTRPLPRSAGSPLASLGSRRGRAAAQSPCSPGL
mmetsp:Transcript_8509/g.27071  ORF Transcript_8509/g.27071 Transcript_8509/m.27071 type:complete len:203 (-) Transcript_8509:1166-1774(-)